MQQMVLSFLVLIVPLALVQAEFFAPHCEKKKNEITTINKFHEFNQNAYVGVAIALFLKASLSRNSAGSIFKLFNIHLNTRKK